MEAETSAGHGAERPVLIGVLLLMAVVAFEILGLSLAYATIGLEWTLVIAMLWGAAVVAFYWWLGWNLFR